MRTIRQLANEYRAADPSSKITEHLIRKLVANGELPVRKAGRNFLINSDVADEYFAKGRPANIDKPDSNTIRQLH
jgi:hypothetical protein